MKKMTNLYFIASIGIIICSAGLLVSYFNEMIREYKMLVLIVGVVGFLTGILTVEDAYEKFIITNRKSIRWKQLTAEELEIVEDAKNLIKKVEPNIIISDFNVYKVKFTWESWFDYDENTHELSIFIPFKRYLKFGKNFCFMLVLHEVLHSQNLKNNLDIFDLKFLEGLNQLLTNWLIKNFSEKYKIPKNVCIASLRIKRGKKLVIRARYKIYEKEVSMVQEIIENSKVDLKEVFLNYINIEPEFFKNFVPEKYFL